MTMTNNPTIDGVSRELLIDCVAYLQGSHRAEVNVCIRLLRDLLERDADTSLIPGAHEFKDAPAPTKADYQKIGAALARITDAPAVERQEPVTLAGLLEKNTIVVKVDVYDEQQSTIVRLEARVAELESGRGEPVAYVCTEWLASGEHATHARREPTHAHTVALYTGNKGAEKYDDVLLPFLAMMRAELHANAHKGDRPGWLQMDSKTAILEVFYHMGKLHQAVHRNETAAIKEYAADVANMCMILLDVCACLDATAALSGPDK